jgi:sugar phosphate isomerase/epimerase
MIRLSAFADEISADLIEQIEVIRSEHIHFIDLRGVWNTNVLDLTDEQVTEIKHKLDAQGIGVSAIASPIGKIPINAPFDEHLQRFKRAIELAQFFHTPFIRIFSFYPPVTEGEANGGKGSVDPSIWRNEVLRRLHELTMLSRQANLILLHENEKDIYGDTIARCVDLLQNINDPHFQAIFDPANFIQCEQTPFPDAYEALRPWLSYIHVKDALADGAVVAAGEGMARWLKILQQLHADRYDGFFSLEPHLALAGQFQGFSGPELFHKASQSFQGLLQSLGWKSD